MKLSRLGALITLLALAACAPTHVETNKEFFNGNYQVTFIDVTQAPRDNFLQNKLDDDQFKAVRTAIIQSLSPKLQGRGQGRQIGVTISLKSVKLAPGGDIAIFTDMIAWDPATRNTLATEFVNYTKNSHTAPLGANVITAIGGAIGATLADATSDDRTPTASINHFTDNVINALYPLP